MLQGSRLIMHSRMGCVRLPAKVAIPAAHLSAPHALVLAHVWHASASKCSCQGAAQQCTRHIQWVRLVHPVHGRVTVWLLSPVAGLYIVCSLSPVAGLDQQPHHVAEQQPAGDLMPHMHGGWVAALPCCTTPAAQLVAQAAQQSAVQHRR